MKKCPSCNRAYSDTVTQCPSCGIDLNEGSSSYGTSNVSSSQEWETHTQKVVDVGKEKKNNGAAGWKKTSAILLMITLLFAGLYAAKISEYDDLERKYNQKNGEYNSLNKEYKKLEKMIGLYDLEGKYTIDITDIYNGTDEYKKISDGFERQQLERICFSWNTHDYTGSWDDVLYVDVLTPEGKIFSPKSENANHTWKIDFPDSQADEQSWKAWFKEGTWKSGTYRIIFYQGSRAIDSVEVKVT